MIRQAKWIACGADCEAPVITKTFRLDQPVSGEIEITGLGFFELYMNGVRISGDRLVPAFTDYSPRSFSKLTYPLNDTLSHRIYYLRYDLTAFLRDGENSLKIFLGNGWYRQKERISEGELSFGEELKALFSAAFTESSGNSVVVKSDGSETYAPSHILYSNLFIGEIQDARLIKGQKSACPVKTLPPPDALLLPQTCPPDRVVREIVPKLLKTDGSLKLYDAGENISGWVRVKAAGNPGGRITIRFSEELDGRGMLDFLSAGGDYTCAGGKKQIQTDTFICDGEMRIFEPKFVFHGFRYFDISGEAGEVVVAVVNSDVPNTSEFTSGNAALNWLYDAYIRSQLSNMHCGVPSDCPHRERLGYTGDGQVACESAMLLLDSREFYRKWIYDILDCQDVQSGHIQHTAPFMGGGGGPGGWGCAVVMVPYAHYRCFGQRELLEHCYPAMLKWVDYMKSRSENDLVVREEKDGWCLGDWATLEDTVIPEPFVNTCYFIKSLLNLVKIAQILQKPTDAKAFKSDISRAKSALIKAYFDESTGSFCKSVQGADAFALDIGLIDDERVALNLAAKYEALGCFDTGFLGTDILVDVLFRTGYEKLAFDLLKGNKKGSYLWMKAHGATTTWEYFDGRCSHNHPMTGAPVRQLFTKILGIGQAEDSAAFDEIIISPLCPEGLDYAGGKILTVKGEIRSSWRKNKGGVTIKTVIPQGVKAMLVYKGNKTPLNSGENTVSFLL